MVNQVKKYSIIKRGVNSIMKTFEDEMMDVIHRCISICEQNIVEVPDVDKIFIMLWKEKTIQATMYDFEISGKFVHRHEPPNNSPSIVFETFDELQKEHELLENLFERENREFPVAFKMIYSPITNKFNMHLEYELITEQTGEDIDIYFEEWARSKVGMTTLDAK